MKFKVGDKVRFLNDVGGGKVNRIDDHGNIFVITEDDFEIPVTEKELVLSRSYDFTEKKTMPDKPVPKTEKPDTEARHLPESPIAKIPGNLSADIPVNLYVGFIPQSNGPVFNSKIACYLINDSPYFLFYLAGKKEGGLMHYVSSGSVEPDTKALIGTFDQTSLSKTSHLHIQILFISKGRYTRRSPVDRLVDLNLVNFSKESYFQENDYFNEKAILFGLEEEDKPNIEDLITIPDGIRELKKNADNPPNRTVKKDPAPDTLEVDLHYEGEGIGNQLTPGAILALQMSRFHSAVEEAISKNIRRLVIIHGLGQGTLKMQIRKEIQEKYPGFIFQDASFKEYGFGATMVHLITDKKQ